MTGWGRFCASAPTLIVDSLQLDAFRVRDCHLAVRRSPFAVRQCQRYVPALRSVKTVDVYFGEEDFARPPA